MGFAVALLVDGSLTLQEVAEDSPWAPPRVPICHPGSFSTPQALGPRPTKLRGNTGSVFGASMGYAVLVLLLKIQRKIKKQGGSTVMASRLRYITAK